MRTIRSIQLHSVGKMQSFSVINQVVHAEPMGIITNKFIDKPAVQSIKFRRTG
jgi:hypothetical protein